MHLKYKWAMEENRSFDRVVCIPICFNFLMEIFDWTFDWTFFRLNFNLTYYYPNCICFNILWNLYYVNHCQSLLIFHWYFFQLNFTWWYYCLNYIRSNIFLNLSEGSHCQIYLILTSISLIIILLDCFCFMNCIEILLDDIVKYFKFLNYFYNHRHPDCHSHRP